MTEQAHVKDPVLILPKSERDRLDALREEIAQEVEELRDELQAIRTALRGGEARKPGEDTQRLGEIRKSLRSLREVEAELHDLRRKDAAIHGEYGIDLDAAQFAIGCRLGRLAQCCGAGEVPE